MYRVDEATCTGCGACVEACPAGAIALVDGRPRIKDALCAECGSCADACPRGAITMIVALDGARAAGEPERPPAVVPVTAATTGGLYPPPVVEPLPLTPRRSRVWPVIGGALVWAARELLPEVLAAWQRSRARVELPASRKSVRLGRPAPQKLWAGHRYRWGRM